MQVVDDDKEIGLTGIGGGGNVPLGHEVSELGSLSNLEVGVVG